jgi:glycogen operon protein
MTQFHSTVSHPSENGESFPLGLALFPDGVNLSWNCCIEAPTDEPTIESFRNRQVKNFLVTLLPIDTLMILIADEVCKAKCGNNNAYRQDNEFSWFDWSLLVLHDLKEPAKFYLCTASYFILKTCA